MEKETPTLNTFTVKYTYNGKVLELADLLKDNLSQKILDIYAWKASQFFAATPREERIAVNA